MSVNRPHRRIRKREEWVFLIEEATQSGENVREFCAVRDIYEHSFYGWRRQFQREEHARNEPLFVPVRVMAEATMKLPQQINCPFFMQNARGLRLEFPSGCTVTELTLVAGVLSC